MSTKAQLITLLEARRGEVVSGEELAAKLGVSRAAVWKAADALRKEGLPLQSAPGSGYSLPPGSDVLSAETLAVYLRGDAPARVLAEADSTNRLAKQWAIEGAPHGSIVVAARQQAGRGRMGRGFASPEGGVYLSLVLRPGAQGGKPVLITAAAAVAVCRTVQRLCGLELGIKWVNDLFYQGRKCCGILCEAAASIENDALEYVVVGVGLNYAVPQQSYPPDLQDIATSLYPGGAAPATRAQIAAEIHAGLLAEFDKLEQREFLAEYRQRSVVVGRPVLVLAQPPWQGYAEGIDDEARLLVRREEGEAIALSSGEISVKFVSRQRQYVRYTLKKRSRSK